MKDHEVRECINAAVDVAVRWHGTQQLRERLKHALAPLVEAAKLDKDGYVLVKEKCDEHIAQALRVSGRRDWPSDELCAVRWKAAITVARFYGD